MSPSGVYINVLTESIIDPELSIYGTVNEKSPSISL